MKTNEIKEYKITTNGANNIDAFNYLFIRVHDGAVLLYCYDYDYLIKQVKEFAFGKALAGEHIHIALEA